MTQDEIIEMAKQAWISDKEAELITEFDEAYLSCTYLTDLTAFAKLVAQHERERIFGELLKMHEIASSRHNYYLNAVVTIRARGDNK
jgi:hypothetical protein